MLCILYGQCLMLNYRCAMIDFQKGFILTMSAWHVLLNFVVIFLAVREMLFFNLVMFYWLTCTLVQCELWYMYVNFEDRISSKTFTLWCGIQTNQVKQHSSIVYTFCVQKRIVASYRISHVLCSTFSQKQMNKRWSSKCKQGLYHLSLVFCEMLYRLKFAFKSENYYFSKFNFIII